MNPRELLPSSIRFWREFRHLVSIPATSSSEWACTRHARAWLSSSFVNRNSDESETSINFTAVFKPLSLIASIQHCIRAGCSGWNLMSRCKLLLVSYRTGINSALEQLIKEAKTRKRRVISFPKSVRSFLCNFWESVETDDGEVNCQCLQMTRMRSYAQKFHRN